MSVSSNMLFVTVFGKADALGDLTATNAVTNTFAGAGSAVGFAAATAIAEGTTASAPYTDATTAGLADGGFITSSETSHMSFDFPYGPTPVSLSVSTTFVSDVRWRRFFVWLLIVWAGESFRSRALIIKTDRSGSYRSRTELS
jgi:hypothetical protein